MKFYASLIGPLLGLYYPLPKECETRAQQYAAMNSSRLGPLWHSLYDEAEVDRQIAEHGGVKLPDAFASRLDYKHHEVFK